MELRDIDRLHRQPTRICAGPSMAPAVPAGVEVRLRAGPEQSIRRGTAVLFTSPSGDHDVLHRFLFKVPFTSYFVHRGDAVDASVGLSRCDRIIGVAALPDRRVSWGEQLAGVALVAKRAVQHARGALHRSGTH